MKIKCFVTTKFVQDKAFNVLSRCIVILCLQEYTKVGKRL